jgi:splicing factor U2AF subunit
LTNVSDEEMQEHYDNFFEDVFVEGEDKYGEVEEMNVCDNLGDHLVGNVYIKFRTEEIAAKAVAELNNRWFGGRPIYAELSPVTDFREACCRKFKPQNSNILDQPKRLINWETNYIRPVNDHPKTGLVQ